MPLFPIISDAATADFLEGCERGQFLLVRDRATGEYLDPKTDISADPERLEHVPASGAGTIVSWSTAPTKSHSGDATETVFGIVQLAEGPWWWAELKVSTPGSQLTGAPVQVGFTKTGPEEHHATIPYFFTV